MRLGWSPEEAGCPQEQYALNTRSGPASKSSKTDRKTDTALKRAQKLVGEIRPEISAKGLKEDGSPDSVGIQASEHFAHDKQKTP